MDKEKVEQIFTYQKPFGNQPERYGVLRGYAKELAKVIIDNCPDSSERTLAIRNLQESVMWANASIAINEKES